MKHLVFAVILLAGTAWAQEDQLLAVLKGDAPLKAKTDACRELARVGTGQAVPVLASLLTDEQLSHMARYALESIPDPAVEAALRAALGQVKGRLLVGVVESLGVRRDAQAVGPLARLLTDGDAAVAQAAARALGRIGGEAVAALEGVLASGAPAQRLAVCEGLLRCAEGLSGAEAAAICDRLLAASDLPLQVRVAALRGAIRGRGAQGVPLLVEALRGARSVPVTDAIRIALELPGGQVTQALVGAIPAADDDTQVLLVQALGNRGDVGAAAALVPLAQQGGTRQRVAAIVSLVQLASPAALPVLAALVTDPEPAVAAAALAGLVGTPGVGADAVLLALLRHSDAGVRLTAIEAVAQRRITAAVPALLQTAGVAEVREASASFKALGELAGVKDLPGVIDALMRTQALTAGEGALGAICARATDPTRGTDKLLAGLAKAQGEPKLALLRVLGTVGDQPALVAVRVAAGEADAAVQETALRVLCDWPTADALGDLARMGKTSGDPRSKLLAQRGQLRLIPLQDVALAQKVAQLKALLPLLEQPPEQRLALAALGELPSVESLAVIRPYLTGEGLKEEASVAAVAVAEKIVTSHPAEVAAAMRQVQTSNSQLAERARKVLALVPPGAAEAGFSPIFNGKDLSGWDGKPGWWMVEDGVLTAESTLEKPCKACNYLIWRGGQPADFELQADFKLSRDANSGIQIRSEERPDWDTFGYQADMTGDGGLVGFVYHHQRGLIAGRGEKAVFAADDKKTVEQIGEPAELLKSFKPGDWNTYRVICRGPEITLYVNGVLMCQISDHYAARAAARGIIALQMHPGPPMKIQFRNIRLKEL